MSKTKPNIIAIGWCNETIRNKKKSPQEKANAYREKAKELEKFPDPMTERKQKEIIDCYTKAMELNPEKLLICLADRSKFYHRIGKNEAAIADIKEIESLPQDDLDRIAAKYVNNTVQNIKKIEEVKNNINALVAKGEISKDQAEAQLKHLDVTTNLVLRMEGQEGMMEKLMQEMSKINQGVIKLQQENKQQNSKIDAHGTQLKEHEEKIKINTKAIIEQKKEIIKITDEITSLDEAINKIGNVLEQTGIYEEAEIKNKIISLGNYSSTNTALNNSLKDYANSFYWTLSNNLLAYRLLSTGNIKGQPWDNAAAGKFEAISEGIINLGGRIAEAVPMFGGTAAAIIKTVGVTSSVVLKVMELYTAAKNHRMIDLVNYELYIGRDELNIDPEQFLNKGLLYAAVRIAENKAPVITEAITDPRSERPIVGIINKAGGVKESFITKVIDPIMDTFFDVKKVNLNEVQKLAIADSALFFAWLLSQRTGKAKDDKALVTGVEDSIKLGEKIAELYVKGGAIDQMLTATPFISDMQAYVAVIKESAGGLKETGQLTRETGYEASHIVKDYGSEFKAKIGNKITEIKSFITRKSKADDGKEIKVMTVTDIVYDNTLLNHPELIKKVLDLDIYSLKQIVDFSSGVSEEVIEEVINNGDVELLSNALLSLDFSNELI